MGFVAVLDNNAGMTSHCTVQSGATTVYVSRNIVILANFVSAANHHQIHALLVKIGCVYPKAIVDILVKESFPKS